MPRGPGGGNFPEFPGREEGEDQAVPQRPGIVPPNFNRRPDANQEEAIDPGGGFNPGQPDGAPRGPMPDEDEPGPEEENPPGASSSTRAASAVRGWLIIGGVFGVLLLAAAAGVVMVVIGIRSRRPATPTEKPHRPKVQEFQRARF